MTAVWEQVCARLEGHSAKVKPLFRRVLKVGRGATYGETGGLIRGSAGVPAI
jgi:hypothetical protein